MVIVATIISLTANTDIWLRFLLDQLYNNKCTHLVAQTFQATSPYDEAYYQG